MADAEVSEIAGFGLTVILNVDVAPLHPLRVDATVTVDFACAVVLAAVNAGRFPAPLAAKPVAVLLLVQPNVAPVGVEANVIRALVSPPHNIRLGGAVIVGFGLMTIRPVAVMAVQGDV